MSTEIEDSIRSLRAETLCAIREILDHALDIAGDLNDGEGFQLLSDRQEEALCDLRRSIFASEIAAELSVTNRCDYIVGFAEIIRRALDALDYENATHYAQRIESAWRVPEWASLTSDEIQALSDRVESGRWPVDPPLTLEEFRRELESEQQQLRAERDLSWQLCGF